MPKRKKITNEISPVQLFTFTAALQKNKPGEFYRQILNNNVSPSHFQKYYNILVQENRNKLEGGQINQSKLDRRKAMYNAIIQHYKRSHAKKKLKGKESPSKPPAAAAKPRGRKGKKPANQAGPSKPAAAAKPRGRKGKENLSKQPAAAKPRSRKGKEPATQANELAENLNKKLAIGKVTNTELKEMFNEFNRLRHKNQFNL